MTSSSDDDGDEAIAMANAMGFGLFVPSAGRDGEGEDDVRQGDRCDAMGWMIDLNEWRSNQTHALRVH